MKEENFAQYISMLEERRAQDKYSEYSNESSEYTSWYEDAYGNDVRKEDYL